MQYRSLGRTGLKVSELCLGTMQFGWRADESASHQVLSAAFHAGINFIDTADIYSRWVEDNPGGVSEKIIGNWIHSANIQRDQLVIATKVRGRMGNGPNDEGLSRAHILQAAEASLRRLKCDYIDLYQVHWYDDQTPIEETLSALTDLVHQGKVRYIGCSNYPAWRLMQALWKAEQAHLETFICLQPHYSLVNRSEFERELAEVCQIYGLGVIPYSPLGGGFLTGKYRPDRKDAGSPRNVARYFNDRNWALLDQLEKIGQKNGGHSISQTALAWLLRHPPVTSPIIGPHNIEQLEDNLGAVEMDLTQSDIRALDDASNWQQDQS